MKYTDEQRVQKIGETMAKLLAYLMKEKGYFYSLFTVSQR